MWMVTSIFVGEASERFVDGVVDDFIDQMMQSQVARRADIHGGTFAHRFHAAENFDGVGVVIARCRRYFRRSELPFRFLFSFLRWEY